MAATGPTVLGSARSKITDELDAVLLVAAERSAASEAAVGERQYEIRSDPTTGRNEREYVARFATITYAELRRRVKGLASAWRYHERHRVSPGDFVCMLGFAGTDFTTADVACAYAQAVSVPLQI